MHHTDNPRTPKLKRGDIIITVLKYHLREQDISERRETANDSPTPL
jgi:hypothetical protein